MIRLEPVKKGICALLLLLLVSCVTTTSTEPYPANWAPIRHSEKGDSCPKIEGEYHDQGEYVSNKASKRLCKGNFVCGSLAFNLLYNPYVFGPTSAPYGVGMVQIKQPSADRLEIVTVPAGQRAALSITEGDFTCGRDGLRLSAKSTVLFLVAENLINDESRIFNVAEDGSLIMKVEIHTNANQLFLLISRTTEDWVRWDRIPNSSD